MSGSVQEEEMAADEIFVVLLVVVSLSIVLVAARNSRRKAAAVAKAFTQADSTHDVVSTGAAVPQSGQSDGTVDESRAKSHTT